MGLSYSVYSILHAPRRPVKITSDDRPVGNPLFDQNSPLRLIREPLSYLNLTQHYRENNIFTYTMIKRLSILATAFAILTGTAMFLGQENGGKDSTSFTVPEAAEDWKLSQDQQGRQLRLIRIRAIPFWRSPPAPTPPAPTPPAPVPSPVAPPPPVPVPVTPQTGAAGADTFRVKLYWETGYYWQFESYERKWCWKCMNGCTAGSSVEIVNCDNPSGDGGNPSYFRFIQGSGAVMIQEITSQLCIQRTGNLAISLEPCNSGLSRQLWTAGQNGQFAWGKKFEITPTDLPTQCITQRHHPQMWETVAIEPTDLARHSDTSYWNMY
jgi:hypothetical protein